MEGRASHGGCGPWTIQKSFCRQFDPYKLTNDGVIVLSDLVRPSVLVKIYDLWCFIDCLGHLSSNEFTNAIAEVTAVGSGMLRHLEKSDC